MVGGGGPPPGSGTGPDATPAISGRFAGTHARCWRQYRFSVIDRALTLAIAIANDPGSYACLLGSGVSRAAGVPTGWEIVRDLAGKLSVLSGADHGEDPVAWYRTTYGVEPEYSALLEALAPRPSERMAILRAYFEPTEGDRDVGLKVPTAAHRAIAQLVARGSIRLILTTNFDRLMEEALAEAGVGPVVVTNASGAESAPPPDRTRCTLVKLHGDYLDTRLRNTPEELDQYDPEMTRLLTRCLEDYGLIVAGWSAQWDTALRTLISNAGGRRYSVYWLRRGDISQEARELMTATHAAEIAAPSADVFFTRLVEQVDAVSQLAAGQAVADRVAVATVKRLIPQPYAFIRLDDFYSGLQTDALRATAGLEVPPPNTNTDEAYVARLGEYETATVALIGSTAAISAWGDDPDLLFRAIKRLCRVPPGSGFTAWLALRKYVSSLAFYAAGTAATHRRRYGLVADLLALRLDIEGRTRVAADALAAVNTLHAGAVGAVQVRSEGLDPARSRRKTPASDRYLTVLRPALRDVVADEEELTAAFERFELLLSVYVSTKQGSSPSGRWAWRNHEDVIRPLLDEVDAAGQSWIGIGIFGSLEAFQKGLEAVRQQWHELSW